MTAGSIPQFLRVSFTLRAFVRPYTTESIMTLPAKQIRLAEIPSLSKLLSAERSVV